MELKELREKRDQYIQYINVEHHANLDALCNQEGIDFMKAKIAFDKKVQVANDKYEKDLIEIHNLFPSSQDPRRKVKEKLANHDYTRKVNTAREEYHLEKSRIHGRTVRLREIEKLELKITKKHLADVNSKIDAILATESSKKTPIM